MVITHDPAQQPPPPPAAPPSDPPSPLEPILEIMDAPEPPSPEEIDRAILEFEAMDIVAKGHKERADELEAQLIILVESFGHTPPHAEQSKRLNGRRNTATTTRGTSISIKEDAVEELRKYLGHHGVPQFFPRFFARNVKHTLVEGAMDSLKTMGLPRRMEEKIASLFGRAFDVKKNKPTLKTKVIQPEKLPRKAKGKKGAA